jgi:monoterpene epsilon-lactone hydrolase
VASLLSKLAPIVITLRGSKRMFKSARRTLAKVARLQAKPVSHEPPRSLSKRVDVAERTVAGWPVYDISRHGAQGPGRVLYLHGGCYVFEIDPIHWAAVATLAIETGARITVPIMPLAPTGTAGSILPAVADLAAVLVDEVGAGNVTVMGDSSGGGMALAVAMELRDRGIAPLGRVVLIAPWLDISGTDPRLAELAPRDPWLAVPGTHAAGLLYRGELSETDWRVSPVNGSLKGLGPITMFSGTRDILNADAMRFVPLAAAAGLDLDYHEGRNMIHNYPILPMPEGAAALKVIASAIAGRG